MNQKKSFLICFSLASVFCFGRETLKLTEKEINISATNKEQLAEISLEELLSESEIISLQLPSKDDARIEIVYPIEESNFEEVFGSHP